MIKLVKRSARNAASPKFLLRQVDYLEDLEKHQGKFVDQVRNINCTGNSGQDFIREVLRLDKRYQLARMGKPGRPGRRLFEEVVYSCPKGALMTNAERETVSEMILDLVGRNSAFRIVWHIDTNSGHSDMHCLLAARTRDTQPSPTLWSRFNKSRHIFVAMDDCDETIVRYLNKSRPRAPLPSARQVRRSRFAIRPLAQEIARTANEPVTPGNLARLIEIQGHTVLSVTPRTISLRFRGRIKTLRYNKAKLLRDIQNALEKNAPTEAEIPKPTDITSKEPFLRANIFLVN
jgi:hypothetical protein